tara:strand:+ start:3512 stop:4489 length:978 start_codon:yes stop_codon:yes gene_type:complete
MISKNTISFILKISIVFFSVYFLYVQFLLKVEDAHIKNFSVFNTIKSNLFSFSLVFFMMFINWIIEAFKWKILIKKIEDISIWTSIRAVFSGITVSTFTPNRVGEYGGRIFCLLKADRIQSILITVIGSIGQLITTVFFGLFGFLFLPNYLPEILDYNFFHFVPYKLCVICVCVLNLYLVFTFLKTSYLTKLLSHFKFLNRFKEYINVFSFYSVKELLHVFLLSNFRYLVFTTQFFILLNTFDEDILYFDAIPLITIMLLIVSIIPTIVFTELSVRGSVAVFLFGMITSNTVAVFSATFIMWIINFVFPALIGTVFVFSLKFFRR